MWCRAVGSQAAARHPKVTGGKAAVSGLESGHFRRQFHRSSDSSCNIAFAAPSINQGGDGFIKP